MSAVSKWIISVFAACVVCIAADLLFSGSRMKKAVGTATATIVLLMIVMPLPSLLKNAFSCSETNVFDYDPPLDEHYLQGVSEDKLALIARAVERTLSEKGYPGASVEIEGRADGSDTEITLVAINFDDSVIDGDDGHINRNESVTGIVCGLLNIDKDKVTVNGRK